MNPIDDELRTGDDLRFDLLVDGELSESERRRLLAGLDKERGGWRRCALALLEAQAWKHELGTIARQSPERPPVKQSPRRSRLRRHSVTLLVMAASFLVALLLGSTLRGLWDAPGPVRPSPAQVAGVGEGGRAPLPAAEQPDAVPLARPEAGTAAGPWQVVTLPASEGGAGPIRVRAIERDRIDEEWLSSFPAPMPEDVSRVLEGMGYRVRQSRELLPLRMKDGRRLVVPVDTVDVYYVGGPTY